MKKILFLLLMSVVMFSCSSDEEVDTTYAEMIAGSYEVTVDEYEYSDGTITTYDATLVLSVEPTYLNLSFDGKNYPIQFNEVGYNSEGTRVKIVSYTDKILVDAMFYFDHTVDRIIIANEDGSVTYYKIIQRYD